MKKKENLNIINFIKQDPYFSMSVFGHILLISLLVFNTDFITNKQQAANNNVAIKKNQPDIIKAVSIDQKLVDKEIARLEKIEQDKKDAEQKRLTKQKKLKAELAKIKKQKEQEAKRLAKIKKQKEELNKNKQKAEQELAKRKEELVKQQQAELKQKKQQELEKKKEELLAKLKQEQEEKMLKALDQEDKLFEQASKRDLLKKKEITRIIGLQQQKVSRNWISNELFIGRGLVTKLEIRLDSKGNVMSVAIVQSSGDKALDISAKNAILKASPLPVPDDSELFKTFAQYRFTFRPDDLG